MNHKEIIEKIKKLGDDAKLEVYAFLSEEFEGYIPEEKIGVEYAYEEFKDIKNLDEFNEKLREINNTRLNYMQPIGLPKNHKQSSLFNTNQ